ncbi:TonB-dependent receptor [Sphingobium sp. BYY-5]|uniref:TonB-dependent receptor domain-containing protein n=1 Tax=Sphingobium sp. BYY-5 TaxID=2926400 RepID=UPI001FA76052|nr:TonB-dependent receptor [Sphingobium sp. BYY-5]MCI4592292.1 TonB-dependent receptor [Sphingobium sp. BYY-5]
MQRTVLYSGICLAACAASSMANARTAAAAIHLPAQSLATSLEAISSQMDINILFTPDVVAGRHAPAVDGSMTVQEAVRRLLVGTGLTAIPDADGGFVIRKEEGRSSDVWQGAGGDIIVTAQKVQQRAMDVPITISVMTKERMEQVGVSDLDELSNYIPGLNIQEQSANNPGIVIRGITSDSGSSQQAARVTLYYNGVDISRSRSAYQGIYDMERIEVVKGPQATLFGTASTIGAISMISAKPKPGLSGEMGAGYGNYGAYKLGGFLNAGSDILAARVAFSWEKRDGYVHNLDPAQGDLYAKNQLGVRASLHFTPSTDFTADLVLTYDRQRNSGTPFTNLRLPPASIPGNPYGNVWLGGSPLASQRLEGDKLGLTRNIYDVNFTANWKFADDWNFTTVNGFRQFDSNELFDADGSRAWYLEFGENARGWQFSHEGRFAYRTDTIRASFGWNYFYEKSNQYVPFSSEEGTFIQCSTGRIAGLGCINSNNVVTASQATSILTGGLATSIPYFSWFNNRGINQSWSVFGETTWLPTPALELTAGVRLLIEKRRSGFGAYAPNSVLTGRPLIPSQVNTNGNYFWAEDSYQATLPRFNALYRIDPNINLYATISKGRRSPTVNVDAASATTARINPIAAENVWNYEGGIKGRAGIISGSLGVYYQKYDNFQVSVQDGTVTRTVSAGTASNLGVEAEVQVTPTSWFNLFGNVGYIDGGVDKKAANGRFAGMKFRLQPEWQAAAGFTLNVPVTEGVKAFLTPSVTYRSKIYFEIPNTELISQDKVTLVNVRGGVSLADGRYEVAAYARNLFNKRYLLDAGNTGGAFGYPTFIPAEPRFYGVQLTGRF